MEASPVTYPTRVDLPPRLYTSTTPHLPPARYTRSRPRIPRLLPPCVAAHCGYSSLARREMSACPFPLLLERAAKSASPRLAQRAERPLPYGLEFSCILPLSPMTSRQSPRTALQNGGAPSDCITPGCSIYRMCPQTLAQKDLPCSLLHYLAIC